ncbi:hypothetical protein ACFX2I_001202 [Malus domestica]
MGDVLWNLEYSLQLQEASTQSFSSENSGNYIPDMPEWLPEIRNGNGCGGEGISDEESDATSSAVFSELLDPRGRAELIHHTYFNLLYQYIVSSLFLIS